MKIRTTLFILSFGLLAWLFVDSTLHLDIAASKNDALINSKKTKVDQLQNIDSVKTYAKYSLDVIRSNAKKDSELSVKKLWIIFVLAAIQIVLWYKYSKSNKSAA